MLFHLTILSAVVIVTYNARYVTSAPVPCLDHSAHRQGAVADDADITAAQSPAELCTDHIHGSRLQTAKVRAIASTSKADLPKGRW
jgi:hypothetical protein